MLSLRQGLVVSAHICQVFWQVPTIPLENVTHFCFLGVYLEKTHDYRQDSCFHRKTKYKATEKTLRLCFLNKLILFNFNLL